MTTTPPTLIHDPWRRLWRFFTGDGFLAAVIIVVAALLLIAARLPQTPASDLVAYSRWLSDARTVFRSLFDPLEALGFFNITSSLIFRLSLALLGFVVALRLIEEIAQLRHAAVADRLVRRRSAIAASLAYGGLLITLLGLFIGAFTDYRADDITVEPGKLASLPGLSYALRLDDVNDSRARVALLQQTDTIAQGEIAPRQSLAGRVTIYLAQIGPALNVTAARGPTETLNLQSTATSPAQPQVLLAFTAERNDAFVAAPQANLVLRVSPTGVGSYAAQIYQSATGKDLGRQPFKPGETISVEGTTFAFQPAAYLVVSAANQPSHWIIAIGLIVTTLGLGGVWLWPGGSAARERRAERAAQMLVRAAWLIATLLVWGQLIAIYPYLASFDGLINSIESGLAAWLLFSGGLVTQHRARWLLLACGLIVGASAVLGLIAALD